MSRKLPQWYGTQYIQTSPDGPMELYAIDETAVTDDDRPRSQRTDACEGEAATCGDERQEYNPTDSLISHNAHTDWAAKFERLRFIIAARDNHI